MTPTKHNRGRNICGTLIFYYLESTGDHLKRSLGDLPAVILVTGCVDVSMYTASQ